MGTSASVFQGTGFCEFQCDCGAAFGDSVYDAIAHVSMWHRDEKRRNDEHYFQDRVVTLISPNVLDFIADDLEESEG